MLLVCIDRKGLLGVANSGLVLSHCNLFNDALHNRIKSSKFTNIEFQEIDNIEPSC